MLIQCDHLALTVEDIARCDEMLRAMGYDQVFSHQGIPNPEIKRELMSEWSSSHSLAFYEHPDSVSLEVIDYGHTVTTPTRYELRAEEFGESNDWQTVDACQIDAHESELETVVVRTSSPEESQQFFTDVGLQPQGDARLTFDPPMGKSSVTCEFVHDGAVNRMTPLDGRGFVCLAFITTTIADDVARLSETGYTTTDISTVVFPHRSVDVAFVTGPTGEQVELLAPA